jgi:tRNA pseudouridine38-40 synthase
VAGVLEDCLSRLLHETVKITGAGRTDAGVHATGQVVSFSTEVCDAEERVTQALNAMLPPDCSVRDVARAGAEFSARFSARGRTYVYGILTRRERSALLEREAWHVPYDLDLGAMNDAARHFIGEHDFATFCTAQAAREAHSTFRAVARFDVERRGQLIRIEIAANAFLHRMVRVLVGTLVECGRGRRRPDEMPGILATRDPSAAGPVAPAHGLYLAGVRYEDGYDSFAQPPLFIASPVER